MGNIIHDAIVITVGKQEHAQYLYNRATELCLPIIGFDKPVTNGYYSLFVPPHGSKQGWDRAVDMSERRKVFIDYLQEIPCEWVAVRYGYDLEQGTGAPRITASAWDEILGLEE
jgi:hypothetical protein